MQIKADKQTAKKILNQLHAAGIISKNINLVNSNVFIDGDAFEVWRKNGAVCFCAVNKDKINENKEKDQK